MFGTFQDRLVSELRLAGASTMVDANHVLWEFLPRFNQRFGVPPGQSESAYRTIDSNLNLAAILCFKHSSKVARDNTVKYRHHTLQLLPDPEHPSYAGAIAEIQECLDGKLVVCYQGRVIPTREASPRPSILRDTKTSWNGELASLPRWLIRSFEDDNTRYRNRARAFATLSDAPGRRPTPRQKARWKAIQAAKVSGLSIREIARELRVSRKTVRKYLATDSPPVYAPRGIARSPVVTSETVKEQTVLTESLVTNT